MRYTLINVEPFILLLAIVDLTMHRGVALRLCINKEEETESQSNASQM